MKVQALCLMAALTVVSCGGGDDTATDGATEPASEASAPMIGTDMEMPVDTPFCSFSAEPGSYVFVTDFGESVYHGYAKLDGTVTKLTEVEAGFGAGMETRRYVDGTENVELEVILLDQDVDAEQARYTGSVRVIYPVEGEAVKFEGECVAAGESNE